MDLETGEERWRADGAYLEAVADGRVYASVEPGVHAVDAADGSARWRNEAVEGPGAVAVRDDTVYVGGGGEWGHLYDDPGRLEALDVADGGRRWTFKSDDTEHFRSPAVGPERVALGSVYRNLYVLDREGGERRWCADVGPGDCRHRRSAATPSTWSPRTSSRPGGSTTANRSGRTASTRTSACTATSATSTTTRRSATACCSSPDSAGGDWSSTPSSRPEAARGAVPRAGP